MRALFLSYAVGVEDVLEPRQTCRVDERLVIAVVLDALPDDLPKEVPVRQHAVNR
jgi:hypothetical protein